MDAFYAMRLFIIQRINELKGNFNNSWNKNLTRSACLGKKSSLIDKIDQIKPFCLVKLSERKRWTEKERERETFQE